MMIKDLSAKLVAAAAEINQKSRAKFVEEQNALHEKMAGKQMKMPTQPAPKAEPAASSTTQKMTTKNVKEEIVTEAEGSIPKTPREKELAAMHGHKKRITFGDVMKARGVGMKKEEVVDEGMLNQLRDRGNVATGQKQQDRKNFDTNTGAALKPNSTISGIRAKMQNKVQEEKEHLEEGDVAHAQFQHYHNETAKLVKNIHGALGKHFDAVTDKKNYMNGQAHWGHVGTIKDIHRSLQDIHDRVLEQGEYAKPAKVMKEETEVASEVDVTLLNLYVNLDEDNRASMMKMLDEGRKEELLEFASTLGDE